MSNKLKQLTGNQKKAVVGLACVIEAQGKGGRFRSNDPEMDIIIRECFDESWVGNWDNDYKHHYLGESAVYAANNQDECFQIIKDLDMETKYAFKNMMNDIIGDNAMMVLTAAYVYKEIGLTGFVPPAERETPRVERNTQENDGTYEIVDSYYRLRDVGAVRGENSKVFTMVDNEERSEVKVGANFDYWLSEGICPVNGIAGYVDPRMSVNTSEGKLCYLVCTQNLIVPVLEWGLEKIDDWEYQEKMQSNRMLSYDKSGKLCRDLRSMKKSSSPIIENSASSASQNQQVVRFTATVQQRIEGGRHFPPNNIQRNIRLTYTKRGSMLTLEVIGVMQPRTAKFQNDDGRILTYEDTTRLFTYYEVETEPVHNSIVRVSIFQKNDNFEDIEYRYTIDL